MIPTGTIAGVTKPVSRIVCGTQVAEPPGGSLDHALPILDAYVDAGGNTFDTARAYGDGATDEALGYWLSTRGVRDDVVIIGKGAHTPRCDPEHVTSQLYESLERLRTDHLDLDFLHRDNPDVRSASSSTSSTSTCRPVVSTRSAAPTGPRRESTRRSSTPRRTVWWA